MTPMRSSTRARSKFPIRSSRTCSCARPIACSRCCASTGIVAAFKDLGAGGIVGCSAELTSQGGFGARDRPRRGQRRGRGHAADVIAVGETQERLLVGSCRRRRRRVLRIYNEEFALPEIAYNARATIVGRVTAEGATCCAIAARS